MPIPGKGRMRRGNGKNQPAVAEKQAGNGIQRLARRRQHLVEDRIPEEKLQQDRDVLKHLDVSRGQAGYQPVGRESGDPDQRPQDNGQDDSHKRNLQRVEHPDEKRPGVIVRRRIGSAIHRFQRNFLYRGNRIRWRCPGGPGWSRCWISDSKPARRRSAPRPPDRSATVWLDR